MTTSGAPTTEPGRYLDSVGCAAYIGRSVEAVRCLVKRGQIPHIKIGRKLQFDKERIDRWMDRHAHRGAMV